MATVTKKEVKSDIESKIDSPYVLWLHNDDRNTFDWVILCLIKVCGHDNEQATQCANIVHYNGLCDVKYGDLEKLSTMKDKLQNSGLSVTLEKN